MLNDILVGFVYCLRLDVFVYISIGVILGVSVGALPGLTAAMAVALLLPVSFFIDPILGIPFLVAITKGAIYGGSIPAILINTPGTAAAAATTLDGFPLARQGKARKALEMALYASVIGDAFSDIATLFGIGFLAKLALLLSSPEFVSIILMSFMIIATLAGNSIVKGLLSAFLGLFLCTVGIDPIVGVRRFTFGILDLTGGISIIPMVIGLFAVSEILRQNERKLDTNETEKISSRFLREIRKGRKELSLTFKEFKESARTIFRSSVIGTLIGNIPGIGQVVSAFLCYGIAKGASKHPEKFGNGSLEGVAAAETGNNAVNGSSLMPLLIFGIPGDIIAAILFSAFMVHGLRPGPRLFESQAPIIYSILWALLLSNAVLLIIGKFAMRYIALIARFPSQILFPSIASLCFVGSYSVNNSLFDVFVMLVFGAIGYIMIKFEYPIAPLLITFILGPLFEEALGQSLIMSDGSLLIFLSRPISLTFILLTPIALIYLIRKLPKVE